MEKRSKVMSILSSATLFISVHQWGIQYSLVVHCICSGRSRRGTWKATLGKDDGDSIMESHRSAISTRGTNGGVPQHHRKT